MVSRLVCRWVGELVGMMGGRQRQGMMTQAWILHAFLVLGVGSTHPNLMG